MSTPAVSGLLAILVCALLQGNPLHLRISLQAQQACLLRGAHTLACTGLPATWPKVESRAVHA